MDSGDSVGIVDRLLANGTFIGGPPELFDIAGDCQLGILKHLGMNSDSKVLDIGCGCLRGGMKVIPELNPGCYFGIETNKEMLRAGLEVCIENQLLPLLSCPQHLEQFQKTRARYHQTKPLLIQTSIVVLALNVDLRNLEGQYSPQIY